jgi:hypothetical protein
MAQTRTGTRRRTSSKTSRQRLRVSFADADRVRRHLLSEQVEVLNTRDIRTMLKILNDIYPTREMRSQASSSRSSASSSLWQPFLLGIGIGLVLLVGALTVM